MNIKKLMAVDPRLDNRYQQLVTEHLNSTGTISAGLRAVPNKNAVRWFRDSNPALLLKILGLL